MDILSQALIAGLVFSTVDIFFVAISKFESNELKRETMITTFVQRFGIGFVIPFVELPVHHAVTGALVAFVFSLPLAIHLKRPSPLFGVIIGFLIGWFT